MEEIAQKLNLQSNESNNITIYTFGASKPKEIMSPVVTLAIKSKDENTIIVKANVVPKISENIQRMSIQLNNRFLIQRRFKLADTLPQRTESSTIRILIGGDYYNEVMSTEGCKTNEGLYLIQSKFGWIISGKTGINGAVSQENTMFVMTHIFSQTLPELKQYYQTLTNFENMKLLVLLWQKTRTKMTL